MSKKQIKTLIIKNPNFFLKILDKSINKFGAGV